MIVVEMQMRYRHTVVFSTPRLTRQDHLVEGMYYPAELHVYGCRG